MRKCTALAIDLKTHRVYAPEQEHDGTPATRITIFEVPASGGLPPVCRYAAQEDIIYAPSNEKVHSHGD